MSAGSWTGGPASAAFASGGSIAFMNWTVAWRRSSCALTAMNRPEPLRPTSAASRATAAWASATALGSMAAGGGRGRRRRGRRSVRGGGGGRLDRRGVVEAPAAREVLSEVGLLEAGDLDDVARLGGVQEVVAAQGDADVVDVARLPEEDQVAR